MTHLLSQDKEHTVTYAIAVYGAAAATLALVALKRAGLLEAEEVEQIGLTLPLCRDISGNHPNLEKQFFIFESLMR